MNSKAPDIVKERPILFSGPMVQAILEGRKTQTRQIMKPQPIGLPLLDGAPDALNCDYQAFVWNENRPAPENIHIRCPHGSPGDRLWVRESFHAGKCADSCRPSELFPRFWLNDNGGLWYPADNTEPKHPISPKGNKRPSIFMPRWASRITLEITDVRVERLNDISEEDAQAEGCEAGETLIAEEVMAMPPGEERELARLLVGGRPTARFNFAMLWMDINGAKSWDENPWVWVVEFKRVNQ